MRNLLFYFTKSKVLLGYVLSPFASILMNFPSFDKFAHYNIRQYNKSSFTILNLDLFLKEVAFSPVLFFFCIFITYYCLNIQFLHWIFNAKEKKMFSQIFYIPPLNVSFVKMCFYSSPYLTLLKKILCKHHEI